MPASRGPSHPERLDSWKEIAAYLGRSVNTAQRWEERGLPVYRSHKGASVYAYRGEIEEWLKKPQKAGYSGPESDLATTPFSSSRRSAWQPALVAGVVIVLAGLGLLATRPSSSVNVPATAGRPGQLPLVRVEGLTRFPTFSPDGMTIAYTHVDEDRDAAIYLKRLPTGVSTRITAPGVSATGLRWSPDGRWIAFANRTGVVEREISLVDPISGEVRPLFRISPGRLGGEYVDWAADSTHIFYCNQTDPRAPLHIESFDLATGTVERITEPDKRGGDHYPNVSPDGSRLAFARCLSDDTNCLPHIRDLNTRREWRVGKTRGPIRGIAWLPDGSAIVAAAELDGPLRLWVFPAEEDSPADPKMLTNQLERAYHPVLRPGGDSSAIRIVYEHQRSADNIWRLDLFDSNSTPEPVIQLAGHEKFPSISRDGSTLSFSADASGSDEIWIARGDGQNPRQVTNFKQHFVGVAEWAPDGSTLSVIDSNAFRLYQVPSLGWRLIDGSGLYPTWSSEGTGIYARADHDDRGRLYRFNLDGAAKPMTADRGLIGREGPHGRFLYFTKRPKSPLGLWRVPPAGGNEEQVASGVRGTEWAVAHDGIYYLDADGGGGSIPVPIRIRRYSPDDGTDEVLREGVSPRAINVERGFAVTWDGRWVYWSQRDRVDTSLNEVLLSE